LHDHAVAHQLYTDFDVFFAVHSHHAGGAVAYSAVQPPRTPLVHTAAEHPYSCGVERGGNCFVIESRDGFAVKSKSNGRAPLELYYGMLGNPQAITSFSFFSFFILL